MSDIEVLSKAQAQLAAIERNADRLLTALSSPGTRPLSEAAAILADTAAVLGQVKAAAPSVDAALAAAAAADRGEEGPAGVPALRVIEALWRQEQQGSVWLGEPSGSPAQDLASLVAVVNALPGITVTLLAGSHPAHQPSGATTLIMLCGPSVAAAVQLAQPGGLLPLRAAFFAPGEEAGPCWPWAESRHLVFRRASELAAAVVAHFNASCGGGGGGQQGEMPSALEMLLLWLATYSDLFSRPCSATGMLLAAGPRDGTLLPPLQRPYRLSWRQLRAAAADPARRSAFHVPPEVEEGEGTDEGEQPQQQQQMGEPMEI